MVAWVSSHTTKQPSDTSWVSYNSTQFWHYLPGESVRQQRLRAQSYKTAPPTSHKITPKSSPDWIRVPGTNSLGSINLLEWVAELREIFYLLDDQFIIKEYNSGTGRWKRCLGQGMEKECGVSVLSWISETLPESTGVCQPRSPLTLILWGFYGGFIICTRLIKSLITADWIQCPLLPRRWGWDWNFQTSNQMLSSAVTQPPSLGSSHVTSLS